MKNIYFFIILFSILGSNYSFADCITGYACSIDSLQAKNLEQEKIFLYELQNYFANDINEDFMLGNINETLQYKDFFPFSIILEKSETVP